MGMGAGWSDAGGSGWIAPYGIAPRSRFGVIVVGRDPRDADVRTAAVDALEGRLVRRLALTQDMSPLDDHVGKPIVIVDLIEQAPVPSELLEDVDAFAARRSWPLIVALPVEQIDAVAASCTRSGPQLLCEPEAAEWIAALAIAAESIDVAPLAERVNESEAARLHRLNSEVARIAEVVARLSRQSEGTRRRQHEESVRAFAPRPLDFAVTGAQVRDVIRARRLRDRFFEGGLFEDPAWDMLLDLLAAQLERAQVSVSSLCIAAAVPPTTALRWITKLTDAGLLEREADPFDKRRAYLKLSSAAAVAMQRYVAAVREANLPFV